MALVANNAMAMGVSRMANLKRIADGLGRKKSARAERFANCPVFPMPFPKGDPRWPQLHRPIAPPKLGPLSQVSSEMKEAAD